MGRKLTAVFGVVRQGTQNRHWHRRSYHHQQVEAVGGMPLLDHVRANWRFCWRCGSGRLSMACRVLATDPKLRPG
jgi:hypothetical protein